MNLITIKRLVLFLLVFMSVLPLKSESADLFVPVDEVYALIRVKNESRTLKWSLLSILPAIKKGVIVYNECTDGSDVIICEFCKENPGFICKEYKHHVIPPNSTEYARSDLKAENRLDTYTNFALDFIPKNKWFLKIDGDQIFDAEKLKRSFGLVKSNHDIVVYPRIDLHYDKGEVFVICDSSHDGLVKGGDQVLVLNTPEIHFIMKTFPPEVSPDGKFHAYEVLIKQGRTKKWAELLNYHFPFLKDYKKLEDLEKLRLVPLKDFVMPFIKEVLVDPLFWDGKKIDAIVSKFKSGRK